MWCDQSMRAQDPSAPVAPVRTKKLRDRTSTSPPRAARADRADRSAMRVGFNANVDSVHSIPARHKDRWMQRGKDSESSRERSSSPAHRSSQPGGDFSVELNAAPERYVYAPRYHPASGDPRFARRYHPEERDEEQMDNVTLR